MLADDVVTLSFRQPERVLREVREQAERDMLAVLSTLLAHRRGLALADELASLVPGLEEERERGLVVRAELAGRIGSVEAQLERNVIAQRVARDNDALAELAAERRAALQELRRLEGERDKAPNPDALAGRVRSIGLLVTALRAEPAPDASVLADLRALLR